MGDNHVRELEILQYLSWMRPRVRQDKTIHHRAGGPRCRGCKDEDGDEGRSGESKEHGYDDEHGDADQEDEYILLRLR